MYAFDSCNLHRFNTGSQSFEVTIYRNGNVHWLSLPSKDVNGKPLDGNNRDVYRSLRTSFPDLNFTSAEQIHSNIVTYTNTPSEFDQEHKCDGLITSEVNKALIIRTADCVPVFIFSHQSISLLHAGHKGIQFNILEKWNEYCPDQPSYLILGDHIKSCCFKVHEDIEKKFRALPYSDPYSITKINKNQWSISLARILYNQWNRLEHSTEHFFDFSNCTCCNTNIHSYRRSGKALIERTGHVIFRTKANK